jgi:hypothetical protein
VADALFVRVLQRIADRNKQIAAECGC